MAFVVFLVGVIFQNANAQEAGDRISWWKSAKLGIFIHCGYYAVDGIAESWSIWNKQITHREKNKKEGQGRGILLE